MNGKDLHDYVARAVAEDVGSGDLTSEWFVPAGKTGAAKIIAREPAVVAGVEAAAETFFAINSDTACCVLCCTGDTVEPGDVVLDIVGEVRALLTAERVALNFLQRLSGVATLTRKYVDAVAGTGAQILDTRKTTPGLRVLEKAAVAAGGGRNHRFGLFDMVMLKDNHLVAGSDPETISRQIRQLRQEKPEIKVEMEADTVEQVRSFLEIEGVDFILLDNMSLDQLRESVAIAKGRVKLEASGGVTLDTVRDIAGTGVDFISVGALTHSARAIDYSLELQNG